MPSDFLIKVVRVDKTPVYLHPNGKGERKLKAAVLARIVHKGVEIDREAFAASIAGRGVGMMRTTAQVVKEVNSVLDDLHLQDTIIKIVSDSIDEIILEMKSEVVPY